MYPLDLLFHLNARQRHTHRDLAQLDDYLLRDVGVTRTDVHRMAHGVPHRRRRGE